MIAFQPRATGREQAIVLASVKGKARAPACGRS
jgi:hypothetical protein